VVRLTHSELLTAGGELDTEYVLANKKKPWFQRGHGDPRQRRDLVPATRWSLPWNRPHLGDRPARHRRLAWAAQELPTNFIDE
jgi:hypothetical protein